MSGSDSTQGPARPTKPSTRSSTGIRHSLNLSSVMGKAFADVMNKEHRESVAEKGVKKTKDTSSRRLSAIGLSTIPASPGNDFKPPMGKEDSTVASKTITRTTRRHSALLKPGGTSSDEQSGKSPDTSTIGIDRTSTLRRRPAPSSALPKYRPKSALIERASKPPSPARPGTRRRFSSSEDEDRKLMTKEREIGRSGDENNPRPISPLPHRALTLKVNLSKSITLTPSTPPKSSKLSPFKSNSPARTASTRPTKSPKTSSSSTATRAALPRPPSASSTSSSSLRSPKTPSSIKSAFGFGKSKDSPAPSPLRTSVRPHPESPLAQHVQHAKHHSSPNLGRDTTPTPTPFFKEGHSQDSIEAEDVELLLAPSTSLANPTPAIPRIQTVRPRGRSHLQTPSRQLKILPTRNDLSYLTPNPPTFQSSPPRRSQPRGLGNDRGSILSWEQVTHDASFTIPPSDVDSMLADIPAPFTPGAASPNINPVQLDPPESPTLSALPSPGDYASISQVLLPEVTPLPAPHHHLQAFDTSMELPGAYGENVMMLRLQLVAAENTAQERLTRLQELEEQLHVAKQSRLQEAEALAQQVSFLEQQLHSSVDAREKIDEERAAYTTSLRDQLREAESSRDQAIAAAVLKAQEDFQKTCQAVVRSEQRKWSAAQVASGAAMQWASVREQAESELYFVRASREMLNILSAGLEQSRMQIQHALS